MPNPSTVDMPVQRPDETCRPGQMTGRFFSFSHEVGHLLVREPFKGGEAGSSGASSSTTASPSEERMRPSVLERVRVLRAQRVNTRSDERYILLKKYEGFVTSRADETFMARLAQNTSDYPVLEAEFELEELSEEDRELAVEGAALVWTIGYRYDGSTRKRESAIYFRRLPAWSDKEIEQGREAAQELTRGIRWE